DAPGPARRGAAENPPSRPGRRTGSPPGSGGARSCPRGENAVAERQETAADLLEAERERIHARHRGRQLRETELLLDPGGEIVPATALSATGLDHVEVDDRAVDGGEHVAKFLQRA